MGQMTNRPAAIVRGFPFRRSLNPTILALLLAAPLLLGCEGGGNAEALGRGGATSRTGGTSAEVTVAAIQTAAAEAFDGERAMEQARRVVGFGPRPIGSDALELTRLYIEETLQGYGLTTRRDELIGDTPRGPVPMANLIAEVPATPGGENRPIVILSGHYDTLNMVGVDFVGANDAGSSTAILLELGRVLAEHAPPMPVWLVFFDGEEAVVQWGPTDGTYGSRHMAQRISSEGRVRDFGAMILLDMIGDADLVIDTEMNSTRWLSDLIWMTAEEIGHGAHFSPRPQYMDDDHRPFMEIGVPSVDLIDFNYGPGHRYWHAPFDTLDKLGAESFQAVGETVLSVLPRLAERFD
jgi:glutaminyl-peptide cyclotransferase